MICPNCNHKEDYDFYICPKCQHIIDTDLDEVDPDFDSELETIMSEKTQDLTYQLDVSELIFEEDFSMRKKNPLLEDEEGVSEIENLVDDLIEDAKSIKTEKVFVSKGMCQKLVGRDTELFKIRQIYQEVKKNKYVSSLAIVGENGIGKTRLLSAFFENLKDSEHFLVQVRAKTNSKNDDYYIFKSILQHLSNINDKDIKDIKVEKLKTLLKESAPFHLYHELKVVFSRLLNLKLDKEIEAMDVMSYDRLLKRSFRQVFTHFTTKYFLIIAIKDFHNIDTRSVDMIEYFLSLPNFHNMLFVMSSEPQDKIQRFLKGDIYRRYYLKLNLLSAEDSKSMVKEILKTVQNLDENTISLITANTNGNPFFIEENVKFLVDSKVIELKDSSFSSLNKSNLKAVKVPVTIEETIQAKFHRMPAFNYALIQIAAVSGKVFYKNMLHVLINVDLSILKDKNKIKIWSIDDIDTQIDQTLNQLINSGIISTNPNNGNNEESEYRFNHETEYNILYESIPLQQRKIYHNYLGQYLESKINLSKEKNIEILAIQYKFAGDKYKASKYYFMAAKNAEERYANRKAIEYYEESLKLLDSDNLLNKIDILHNLGSLYNLIGKSDKAIESFAQMAHFAMVILFYNKVGAAYNKIGRIYRDNGNYEKSEKYLQYAYDYFTMGKDRRGIASTQDDMGRLYWQKGNFDKALNRYMISLDIRKKLNETISIALSLNNIGLLYYSQGFVKEAEEYLLEAYKIRKEIKDRKGEMASLNNMASLTYNKGDDVQAKALWMKSLTIAEEVGDIKYQAICMNNLGEVFLENSNYSKAEDYLKGALEIALETSSKRILAHIYQNMGELLFKQKQIAKAKNLLEQAIDLADEMGDNQVKGRVYCILGDIESETIFDTQHEEGDGVEPAEDYYLRSIDLLRKVSEPLVAATSISYAQFLLPKGKKGKAKKLLAQAEKIYENYNMQLHLSKVRRLQKELF